MWSAYIPISYSPLKNYFTPINGVGGGLCAVVKPGFVNGGQKEGAKRPSGGGGGVPPPTVGRFILFYFIIFYSCMKTTFPCTLNVIIRGYTNPYSPLLKIYFTPINRGRGAWVLVPLSYVSDSGATRICQRGAKRLSGGGCGRGGFPSPSHGKKIFEKSCLKRAFSCALNAIIRGNLCCGI